MARSGDTDVEFNPRFFETVLRQPKVEQLTDAAAERALSNMKANAPVDTAEYRDGLHIEHRESRFRRVTRVVGDDEKTLLIESKQGVMARGLKAAKG
ncbi:HK97 gp10 family phage protein [Microbacterium stercoris]|uniref:HK97 gp10 family phage protein n=1 Tax=Microbacterium stercoris TaxID=2820289 RepID=A0A939QL74_9MICO|nr:HK97 gp10 family phage protein [Microbacterium stercoris]MBO3663732.1 HK97 gp10 family phage protein [Microbacterium stercoris]